MDQADRMGDGESITLAGRVTADFDIWYNAALALLHGISPYSVAGFYSPAWALLPFLPLTLLPMRLAAHVWTVTTLIGLLVALYRFRLRPAYLVITVLLSPLVWLNLAYANVEWLVLLGATLQPRAGVWLVVLKPQMGAGVVALWAWQRRWRRAALLPLPVGAALVVNYAVFGLPQMGQVSEWSSDMFPWTVPLGVWLLVTACKRNDTARALASTLFAAPYVGITSWVGLAPLIRTRRGLVVVLVFSWVVFAAWRLR